MPELPPPMRNPEHLGCLDTIARTAGSRNGGRFAFNIVEIGCFYGESSAVLAKHASRIYCIDPWEPYPTHGTVEPLEKLDPGLWPAIEQRFDETMAPFGHRVRKIKHRSLDVAASVAGLRGLAELPAKSIPEIDRWSWGRVFGGVDLVYLDATHDYDSCRADIQAWRPLIRPGGWFAGHDIGFAFDGVGKAIAAEFDQNAVLMLRDTSWMVQLP